MPPQRKSARRKLPDASLAILEQEFARCNYITKLSIFERDELAHRVGLSTKQLLCWYQNRRARIARHSDPPTPDQQQMQSVQYRDSIYIVHNPQYCQLPVLNDMPMAQASQPGNLEAPQERYCSRSNSISSQATQNLSDVSYDMVNTYSSSPTYPQLPSFPPLAPIRTEFPGYNPYSRATDSYTLPISSYASQSGNNSLADSQEWSNEDYASSGSHSPSVYTGTASGLFNAASLPHTTHEATYGRLFEMSSFNAPSEPYYH